MPSEDVTVRMGVDPRRLRRDLKSARGAFNRFGKGIARSLGGSLKRGFSTLTSLGGFGGVAGLAVAGKQVLEFESTLSRLQIQMGSMTDTEAADLKGFIGDLSAETGIAREQVLGAANALVNLQGSAGLTKAKLAVLAQANVATGASMEDLAGLAFSLNNAFGIGNAAELRKGLSGIIEAGKQGAVPLAEMSQVLQQVSATFKDVGGAGPEAAADMAASLQILRRGFGSAAEAGTGLQALVTALTKKSGKLQKLGVTVFDSAGKFRSMRDILDDFEKADLPIKKLVKAFGRVEGAKAVKTLLEFRKQKGDLLGFEEIAAKAKSSNAVIEDMNKRRASQAFRIEQAFNNAKLAMVEAFTPARIEKFTAAVEKLVKLLEFAVDNPMKTLAGFTALKAIPAGLGAVVAGAGGRTAAASAGAGLARGAAGAGGAAAASAGGMGLAGAGALVAGAAAAGVAVGVLANRFLDADEKISDFLAGTDGVRSQDPDEAGAFDPGGKAARLREKARQLAAQGAQPGLVAALRKDAENIERTGFEQIEAAKQKVRDRLLAARERGVVAPDPISSPLDQGEAGGLSSVDPRQSIDIMISVNDEGGIMANQVGSGLRKGGR